MVHHRPLQFRHLDTSSYYLYYHPRNSVYKSVFRPIYGFSSLKFHDQGISEKNSLRLFTSKGRGTKSSAKTRRKQRRGQYLMFRHRKTEWKKTLKEAMQWTPIVALENASLKCRSIPIFVVVFLRTKKNLG